MSMTAGSIKGSGNKWVWSVTFDCGLVHSGTAESFDDCRYSIRRAVRSYENHKFNQLPPTKQVIETLKEYDWTIIGWLLFCIGYVFFMNGLFGHNESFADSGFLLWSAGFIFYRSRFYTWDI